MLDARDDESENQSIEDDDYVQIGDVIGAR